MCNVNSRLMTWNTSGSCFLVRRTSKPHAAYSPGANIRLTFLLFLVLSYQAHIILTITNVNNKNLVSFPNPLAPDIQIHVSWGTRLQELYQCHHHHSSCKPELSWTCSFPAERFLNKDEYFQSLHEILKLYMRPSIPTQQATMAYPPKTKVMPHFRGRKSDFEPDPRPGHSYRIYFLF